MQIKLIPHYFKFIGLFLGLITFILLMVDHFEIYLIEVSFLNPIIRSVFLLALLMMCFSYEKQETSKLNDLRLEHLKSALIFGTFMLLFQQIESILFSSYNDAFYSGFELMSLVLIFYLFTYNLTRYFR